MSAAEEKIVTSRIRAGLAWLTPLLFLLAALVAPAAPAASAKTLCTLPNRAGENSTAAVLLRPAECPQTPDLQRENSIGRYDLAVGDTLAAESTGTQFGNDANQVAHAFRHVDAAGLDRAVVQNAIRDDLETAGANIVPGQPFNQTIQVGNRSVTYTAFKLPNGAVNVGRITLK